MSNHIFRKEKQFNRPHSKGSTGWVLLTSFTLLLPYFISFLFPLQFFLRTFHVCLPFFLMFDWLLTFLYGEHLVVSQKVLEFLLVCLPTTLVQREEGLLATIASLYSMNHRDSFRLCVTSGKPNEGRNSIRGQVAIYKAASGWGESAHFAATQNQLTSINEGSKCFPSTLLKTKLKTQV